MEIGERIRKYRKLKKLSRRMFAELCGVSYQTLYSIENGLQSPTKNTVKKIETAMGEK